MDETIRPQLIKENDQEQNSKTMRPNIKSGSETTNRYSYVGSTIPFQDDKTMRPAEKRELQNNIDATLRPDLNKTLRAKDQREEINSIVQAEQTEFVLKGKAYTVVDIISQKTGEAQIYIVENGGDEYVLKLYYLNIQPPVNMQIIEKVKNLFGSELLINIYDCGEWINPKTSEVRQYELMEYCRGGSLESISINKNEALLGEIAIQCATAIHFLNNKNIIHRDIKPANFFYKTSAKETGELRLGDFGIAVQTDENGKAIIKYQLRTKIYAAPEYYLSIDEEIEIDHMSDFYSLGMMLLVLWNGDELFKINELELVRLKIDGKLPYPKDVSDRTLQLLKALTIVNPKGRAGYNEVVRWAKGENIYDLRKESNEGFHILFDSSENQVASSPQELGQLMYNRKELATKYLYSGKVAEWLMTNKLPEVGIEIEDIVENQYPKNKEAGLLAACYLLDKSIPYKDVQNNDLDNLESIAKSLRDNFNQYSTLLTDENDSLFLFFNSHGLSNITGSIAPLFKENSREALLQLIYTLNPNQPWFITTEEQKEIVCHTLDDVILATKNFVLDTTSWLELTNDSFLLWVRNIDPSIEGKIRSLQSYTETPWSVIYNLNPKVSYNLVLDKDGENEYYFTASQIGDYLDNQMILYLNEKSIQLKNIAKKELYMLSNIDNTRLYFYLKSKGVYDDKIEWIKYCMDLNSDTNSNKYAPYNRGIGIYKTIKGLGHEPNYYFPKSDIYISTLEELESVPIDEIKVQLVNGLLKEWIAIFFQENPATDLSEKYTFEKLTVDYIKFLSKYDINDKGIARYINKSDEVMKRAQKLVKVKKSNHIKRIILGIIVTLAVVITSYKILFMDLSLMANSEWVCIVPFIIGALVARYRCISCGDGVLKSLFIGLASFFGLGLLIYTLPSSTPYIFIGILVARLLYIAIVCYIKPKLNSEEDKELLNPRFEELHLEPLHYAFVAKPNKPFRSSFGERSSELIKRYSENSRKIVKQTIILIILSATIFYSVSYLSDYLNIKDSKQIKHEQLIGEYKGTFEDRDATLYIDEATPEKIYAHIQVQYKNMIDEMLNGTINIKTRIFHFDDVNDNNKLDGEYNGKFNEDFTELSGIYTNYRTNKQVEFKFKR